MSQTPSFPKPHYAASPHKLTSQKTDNLRGVPSGTPLRSSAKGACFSLKAGAAKPHHEPSEMSKKRRRYGEPYSKI
jgi:hypothetical protein